jgi:hypothetical protein
MKPKYQTIKIADITLSEAAQKAISDINEDAYIPICENLDKIALRLCEESDASEAFENLDLVTSILKSRNLIYHICVPCEDD